MFRLILVNCMERGKYLFVYYYCKKDDIFCWNIWRIKKNIVLLHTLKRN